VLLLAVAAGAMAYHLYQTHVSSGYAPLLRAALESSRIEERALYIHYARIAVRTVKDREKEGKLELMQADLSDEAIANACHRLESRSGVLGT
jgi:hypothetical protein